VKTNSDKKWHQYFDLVKYPRKSRYFIVVGQSFVKTVADRHGHATYHNKH